MRHEHDIGHHTEIANTQKKNKNIFTEDFVLEKSIFNNIFEKDIRKVFIYKKTERLAKAIHLIAPAFAESMSLRNRIDEIAIGLVDAAILSHSAARVALSRELLALSSILSIARTGGLLSHMNAELIAREAQILLHEVAAYEEPRLFLDEAPTLSSIAKKTFSKDSVLSQQKGSDIHVANKVVQGHLKDTLLSSNKTKDRHEAILSVIKNKGKANIKDISTIIRGVSEKTIQRELMTLIDNGIVFKQGVRRWSTYSLIG